MKPNNFLREAKLRLFEKFNYYPPRNGDTFDHSKLIISNKRFVEELNWALEKANLSEIRFTSIRDALIFLNIQGNKCSFNTGREQIYYHEFEGVFTVREL
jgi:hypothetical protein